MKNKFLVLFWGLINLLCSQVSRAQTVFAGVEIGSKGVKFAVLSFGKGYDGRIWFRNEFEKTHNTDIIAATPSAIQETAEAVKNFCDTAKLYFNIPLQDVILVVSSGAMQELEKKNKVPELTQSIKNALNSPTKPVYFVTPKQEGLFTAISMVPRSEIEESVVIDIGSGNTKGGYFGDNSYKNFEGIALPYGTKTITKTVKNLRPADLNDFQTKTKSYITEKLPEILEEMDRKPALSNRKTVYLSGGIVWAVNSTMHPERISETYSKILLQDVQRFNEQLILNYEALFAPSNANHWSEETKKDALKNLNAVKNTFDRESLIAGGQFLEQLLMELNRQNPNRNYKFYKHASWSWITSIVLLEFYDRIK